MRILLSLVLILFSVQFSAARDMRESELKNLENRVAQFSKDIESANVEGVIDVIPPKVLDHISKKSGIELKRLKVALSKQMGSLLKQAVLEDMSFDLSSPDIIDVEMDSGEKLAYSIVPIEFTMTVQSVKTKLNQPMFVILEAGKWYLVRVEQPAQVNMLREIYPFVKSITFPESKQQILE